jgi:ribosomal protein S18 acetylase RimI-like enzyme
MQATGPCQGKEVASLAAMLARAFAHDPLYEYVFPDPATRERGTAWDMGGVLRYGIRFGEVLASPEKTACAVWLPPGETDFTEARMSDVGMLNAASHIGEDADRRLNGFVHASEEHHRRIVARPHWYLVVLGVEPQAQSRGLGSALLMITLRRAAHDKLPVYLETINPRNVAFYERRGFVVRAEAPLPEGDVTVWYMVRDPECQGPLTIR